MMFTLENGYVVFEDGSRIKAISGAQDLPDVQIETPSDLVDAFNVDFVLNVGGDDMTDGGVPFGDPDVAGYMGLSDFLRDGGDSGDYLGTVANNSSLSDAVRSGSEGGAFNPDTMSTAGAGQSSDFNITSVIDSVTKGILSLGQLALAGVAVSKSPSGGQTTASGGTKPSLAQQLGLGLGPGVSGAPVNMLFFAAILAAVGFVIFTLARR